MNRPPAAGIGSQGTVAIPAGSRGWSTLLRVLGPAYLVAVGYIDPGNWGTDLAAGSTYGYRLLWVVALSSLITVVRHGGRGRLAWGRFTRQIRGFRSGSC
jgi:Mn2+/Fe2+ NRAMP family transporter